MKYIVHIGIIVFAAQQALFKHLPGLEAADGPASRPWLGGLAICALFALCALFKMFQDRILPSEDLKDIDLEDVKLPDHWWCLLVLMLIGADGIFNGLAAMPKGAAAMLYGLWVVADVLCGAVVWLYWSHARHAHERELRELDRRSGSGRLDRPDIGASRSRTNP